MMIDRRVLLTRGGLLGAGLAMGAPVRAQATPDLSHVDPEMRAVAARLLAMPQAGADMAGLLQTRKAMAAGKLAEPLPDIPVERRMVPGRGALPDVLVYVINARPGARRGAVLHIHGGGFVVGRAADAIRVLQEVVAKPLDCVVVTVDYRLAPETRWQGSTEDNYAALKWLYANADALGIDPARIAVAGESAGGGHAALLAIRARDRGEVPLVFQCLTYPMLDDRTGSSRPVPPFIGTIIHKPANNRFGWRSFLGVEPGGPDVPTAAVPARVADLKGLPPTWIGVGGIDLFVDEDLDYARRLTDADVPTEMVLIPGAFHGFDFLAAESRGAKLFNAARFEALHKALASRAG